MSLKNVNKPEKNVVELELFISKADFDAQILKVYKRQVGKINVPGFRRGKAPKSIIEKMYGKGVFYEDALNDLIPGEYDAAVKQAEIRPVAQPEISVGDINDEGVQVTAKVVVYPEVTLTEYKDLPAEKVVVTATDEDVEREVSAVRERNARMTEINDRPAQLEDMVNINYLGKVDGEPFEGGKGEQHNLTLGSGQFIPGFEEQVVGHSIGEDFEVNVKFPEDYHAEELKGKDAVFEVHINSIRVKELPELDDEFAKDVSEFDTLDEYKADVKAKIQQRYDSAADGAMAEKVYDALLSNMTADIPEAMVNRELNNMLNDFFYRMQLQGISMETYFKLTGTVMDDLKNELRPQAVRNTDVRVALLEVAKRENIAPTEEQIAEEFRTVSAMYHHDPIEVRKAVGDDDVIDDLKVRMASDFVKAHAKVTVVTAEEKAEKEAKERAEKEEKEAKEKAEKAADKAEKAEKADKAEKTEDQPKAEKPKTTRKKAAPKTEDKTEDQK